MILRDRNPCMCIHVVHWERRRMDTYSTVTAKRIAQTFIAKQKELDPTRTSTYAADVANVFHGVNEVIPVRGFNYRSMEWKIITRIIRTQPIVGTEMGSTVTTRGIYEKDSIKGYLPDEDMSSLVGNHRRSLVDTCG